MLICEQFPALKRVVGKEIGIEVEMEGKGLLGDMPGGGRRPAFAVAGWRQEEDGSLRGESMEFVLNVPIPRKQVKKALTALSNALAQNNVVLHETDRCGVHVHLNVQELTTVQAMNIIILYLIVEDLMVRYCGEDREGNLFCLRACDADMMIQQLRECKRTGSLMNMANNMFRYASINIAAIAKYGSLEFRSLKTPKNMMDIEEWVKLILCIRDAAVQYESSEQIVEGFSKNGEKQFLQGIFGDLYKKVYYKDCEQAMQDGVRRVQEVAYTKEREKPKLDDMMYGIQPMEANLAARLFENVPRPARVRAPAARPNRGEMWVINGHPQIKRADAPMWEARGWIEEGDECDFGNIPYRWNGDRWAHLTVADKLARANDKMRQVQEDKYLRLKDVQPAEHVELENILEPDWDMEDD